MAVAAFDARRNLMIIHGGFSSTVPCGSSLGDTWVYRLFVLSTAFVSAIELTNFLAILQLG